MKKRVCRIVGWALLCVLIFTACGAPKETDEGVKVTSYYDEASYEGKQITVQTLINSLSIQDAAKQFEKKTGIRVFVIENCEGESLDTGEIEKYEDKALSDLMAGKGADIYDVRYLDYANMGKRGMLKDLKEWINEDPNLSNEKIFQNLLFGAQTKDGLFGIPTAFMARKLRANSDQEPELGNKRMTWKEFFDTVRELPTKPVAYDNTELNIFMRRFESRANEFIDEGNGTQTLDSTEMIAMLEECAKWRDEGLCRDSRDSSSLEEESASYMGSVISPNTEAEYFCEIPEYIPEFPVVAPMISDAKNPADVDTVTVELYGVNANSENQEEAWQFLQFLLSEEFQESGSLLGTPINRDGFRKTIEKGLEEIAEKTDNRIELNNEECLARAEAFIDQAGMIIPRPYYETLIQEPAKEYFLDKITAEEAAQRMADKVGLYLKEQG